MKFQPKTDWKYDDTPTEGDFNRIEQGIVEALEGTDPIIQQNIPPDGVKEGRLWLDTSDDTYQGTVFESLKGEIGAHLVEKATLTKVGHVQLNSSTISTDETTAATPKAVKAANDNANSRIQSSTINKPNGVAGLDANGKLPSQFIAGAMVKISEVNFAQIPPAPTFNITGLADYKKILIKFIRVQLSEPFQMIKFNYNGFTSSASEYVIKSMAGASSGSDKFNWSNGSVTWNNLSAELVIDGTSYNWDSYWRLIFRDFENRMQGINEVYGAIGTTTKRPDTVNSIDFVTVLYAAKTPNFIGGIVEVWGEHR
ncbi:tail fiber protein [Cytobacillus praedii]|uniref:Uncharacterized protein n=1 Tax=Cytobacillus praedii TaxID=1742358 RepID=A0A4R1AUY1_9BACI|nr:phage tail protein [Cytobacillus praedii]TCJ04085.1 hypothetical protein E0Y62_11620 [Cytobacillus praedii]